MVLPSLTLSQCLVLDSDPNVVPELDSSPGNIQVAALQLRADHQESLQRRPYGDDLFICTKVAPEIPKEVRCSECARSGKSKVYRGDIWRSNVIRHFKDVHKVAVTAETVKHRAVFFKYVRDKATARRLMVQYHATNNLALRHWDQPVTRQIFQPYSDAFGVLRRQCGSASLTNMILLPPRYRGGWRIRCFECNSTLHLAKAARYSGYLPN